MESSGTHRTHIRILISTLFLVAFHVSGSSAFTAYNSPCPLQIQSSVSYVVNTPVLNDEIAWSLARNGNTLLAGMDDRNSNTGGVAVSNVLSNGTIQLVCEAFTSDGSSGDFFGEEVAVYGTTVVGSTPWKSTNIGSVYIFDNSCVQQQKIIAVPTSSGMLFGRSLAIYQTTLFIGSQKDRFG